MRRPLKPFVTEYKSSTRRHKEAGDPGSALFTDVSGSRADAGKRAAAPFDFKSFEAQPPEARHRAPSSSRETRFGTNGSEDGYEAALRAADALFAPSTHRVQSEHDAAEQPLFAQALAEPANGETFANGKAPPSGHGRILRSLEEPTAPSLDDREEALPKRRGRKPGSKNKPKIVAPDLVERSRMPDLSVDEDVWQPQDAAAETEVDDADRLFEPAAHGKPFRRVPLEMRPLPPLPAHRGLTASRERFAWVRRQLAPGERWKRRLPKVVW